MKKILFLLTIVISFFFFKEKDSPINQKRIVKSIVKKEFKKKQLTPIFIKEYLPEIPIDNEINDNYQPPEHFPENIDEYTSALCADRELTEDAFNYWECKDIQDNIISSTINVLDRRINGLRAINIDESDFEPIDYSEQIENDQFNTDELNLTN